MNEKLRAARIEKGWSQEDAAEATQVSLRTYQRWEHEEHIPNLTSRRLLRGAFLATDAELGFDRTASVAVPLEDEQEVALLTSDEFTALSDLLGLEGNIVVHFDESKRRILHKLVKLAGIVVPLPEILANTESGVIPTEIFLSKSIENNLDLDLIDSYTETLRRLLAKGEAQYVMHSSHNLYNYLLQEYSSSRDIRLAEAQLRLGMLVGAAQEYALPWYQRDQAILQTYNHIEENILGKFDINSSLRHDYVRLLAKRGRQHRVLWQFESSVKECEDGLVSLQGIDDFSLRTHFLCERAHIEATRGDELIWMRKLEEARRGAVSMHVANREHALNQVDYMQGEGYKRFAFHTQKDLSMSVRKRYANYALNQFTQWKGATIELPGFEALVAQVSKAQCLILVEADEAIRLAGQLGKQAEQHYPALLDKIYRVVFLAQQRLQMSNNEFSQIFKDVSQSVYRAGRNIL